MPDVRIVKDSADGLTEQLCSRMALNTEGVFNDRDVIADMHKCEFGDVGRFFQCSWHHSEHTYSNKLPST